MSYYKITYRKPKGKQVYTDEFHSKDVFQAIKMCERRNNKGNDLTIIKTEILINHEFIDQKII